MTGPSIRITETGQVQAGRRDLAKVPLRKWFHLELDFVLGSAPPTYGLTIGQSGKPSDRTVHAGLALVDPASRKPAIRLAIDAPQTYRLYRLSLVRVK